MVNKMDVKYAIFDMDGTLVDSLMIWDVMWSRLGEKYLNDGDFRPSVEDDKAVRTLTLADAMNMIHQKYRIGESGKALLDTVSLLITDFYRNDVQLKRGVRELLDNYLANGVKMCIASATDINWIRIAMEHCEIEKYFVSVISCADIGKGKDKPDIFFKACEVLGCTVDEAWLFEDSLVAIETATAMGMKTVGVFDRNNYGQDRIKVLATVYVDGDESIDKLI